MSDDDRRRPPKTLSGEEKQIPEEELRREYAETVIAKVRPPHEEKGETPTPKVPPPKE